MTDWLFPYTPGWLHPYLPYLLLWLAVTVPGAILGWVWVFRKAGQAAARVNTSIPGPRCSISQRARSNRLRKEA